MTENDGLAFDIYQKFRQANVVVKLWYLPTDSGIPTVLAASDDAEMMDAAMLVMGVGTHMDARIAVLRALTEVAQSRATQNRAQEKTPTAKRSRAPSAMIV